MQAALKRDRVPEELYAQWLQEWYAIKNAKRVWCKLDQLDSQGLRRLCCDLPDLDTLRDLLQCNRFDSDAFSNQEIACRRHAKQKRLRRDAKAGHLKTQCGVVKGECPGFGAATQAPFGLGARRNMVGVRFASSRSAESVLRYLRIRSYQPEGLFVKPDQPLLLAGNRSSSHGSSPGHHRTTGLSNKADQSAFDVLEGVTPDGVDLQLSNYSTTAAIHRLGQQRHAGHGGSQLPPQDGGFDKLRAAQWPRCPDQSAKSSRRRETQSRNNENTRPNHPPTNRRLNKPQARKRLSRMPAIRQPL